MKVVRVARNKFRDLKRTKLLFLTYVLTFPDGEYWMKQQEMSAHDMMFELKKIIAQHRRQKSEWKDRAMAIWRCGECWWKDEAGVEHLIMLEDKRRPKRELRWGVNQAGFANFRTETGTETPQ
jgi:hypothetical protein